MGQNSGAAVISKGGQGSEGATVASDCRNKAEMGNATPMLHHDNSKVDEGLGITCGLAFNHFWGGGVYDFRVFRTVCGLGYDGRTPVVYVCLFGMGASNPQVATFSGAFLRF